MIRRFIMRIELTASAKKKLSVQSSEQGMTQVAIMSRLTEWFSAQDELVRAAILGRYPGEIAPDVAKLILERMAKKE